MWDRLTCVTPPAAVVDLDTTKRHLTVDFTDDDALITGLVEAAQAAIVGPRGIGIALAASTWRLSLDAFPTVSRSSRAPRWPTILLPLGEVTAVTSITYLDTSGAEQTLDPSGYVVDLDSRPARIVPATGKSFPATADLPGAVKIIFEAGPDEAPADLKHAALLLVGHWYSNREAVIADNRAAAVTLPFAVDAILDRYRDHAL